ncbi:MAG: hypothetical protein ACRDUA_08400 [Micromonosporaceae bacterium]
MTELLRRRWLVVLIAAWGLLLLTLGLAVGYGGAGSAAEQGDIAEARAPVDATAVELVNAVGSTAAVRVWPYQLLAECRITLVRGGVEYHRRIELFTRPGTERALLTNLAQRLPKGYQAETYAGDDGARLAGQADGFVKLVGKTTRRGVVTVDLRTGCRPEAGPVTDLRVSPTRAERLRLAGVLELAGVTDRGARWRTGEIDCGESVVRSVRLAVRDVPARPLQDSAELVPPDARVLLGGERLLAYRQGAVSVVVEVRGERLWVTSTSATC